MRDGIVVAEAVDERSGARNLMMLAAMAAVIALLTTVVGVYLYVSSGDIYLDRSLPGLLPVEPEEGEERDEVYVFYDNGEVNRAVLDEFLEHFGSVEKEVEEFVQPFADEPISDEALMLVVPGDAGVE